MSSPYNMPWGASIWFKVTATNIYGTSLTSEVGNGAIILTNPDAPVSFERLQAFNTLSSLTLSWSEGAANGGTPVIDYSVYWASGSSFSLLQAGISDTQYEVTGLT